MSPRTLPLLLAQEQGLFANHGLEARTVMIKGAPILVASLVSGELEIGYTGGSSVVGAAAQGVGDAQHGGRHTDVGGPAAELARGGIEREPARQ